MNTKTLALLASLVVLTTVARAAQSPIADEVVVLPTYTVEAPRHTPAEKAVNASLDAMRQLARAPLAVPTEYPALRTVARAGSTVALQFADKKAVRLAKS